MKGRKKKEREEVIASPRQRHLVFYTGRGGETVVFFFIIIELDVVVVQANKEKGKRFLSMDVVDDVIDHLFCSVPLIYFEF